MQRPIHLPGGIEMLWQLPEMVHSLQKELFFYPPDKMIPEKQYQEEMKKLREELSVTKERISELEKANKILENKTVPMTVSRPSLVDWNEFEFCTKKKGAYGPTKNECLEYYNNIISKKYSWIRNSASFEVCTAGFQTLTIPVSTVYEIHLVAPGNSHKKHPGVRIIGEFELERGQKLTTALGQQGNFECCGSGGSILVLESDEGPKPLLIAGGAGYARDEEFGRGNIKQTAVGNENVGTSGKQKFFDGDKEDIYCAGVGFYEGPRVSILAKGCVAPKSYKDGLTGGKGVKWGRVLEGGFGGGGGKYYRYVNRWRYYYGAGGGFTGGSTKVDGNSCWGGGGGSYSVDPNAKFDHEYVDYGYCKIKKV